MPGEPVSVGALVDDEGSVGERGREGAERSGARSGHGERSRIDVGNRGRLGEAVGQSAVGSREWFSARAHDPRRVRLRAASRYLLSQHGSERELVGVDGAGNPTTRRLGHERSEDFVAGEVRVDRYGVGVEIEQSAAAVHGRGEIAQVGERQPAPDVIDDGDELDDAVTVREAKRPAVRARLGRVFLDARHGGRDEVREDPFDVERFAKRQPQIDAPYRRVGTAVAAPRSLAQLGRRRREHFTHGRVELAHAREAGGPRDRGDVEGRGLDEEPRGLGPLRARQREWSRSNLGEELALDLPDAVAEAAREAGHAFAVDHSVGDAAHRAGDDVGAHVPLG